MFGKLFLLEMLLFITNPAKIYTFDRVRENHLYVTDLKDTKEFFFNYKKWPHKNGLERNAEKICQRQSFTNQIRYGIMIPYMFVP